MSNTADITVGIGANIKGFLDRCLLQLPADDPAFKGLQDAVASAEQAFECGDYLKFQRVVFGVRLGVHLKLGGVLRDVQEEENHGDL